jgi:hypothetical protein
MVLMRTILSIAAILAWAPIAHAAKIDLSQPYGEGRGCAFRIDQAYSEEPMVLLTSSEIATAMSLCSFTVSETMKDGSLKLDASCAEEGEEGTSPASFTVKQGAKPDTLTILDDSGQVFAEVQLCK